MELATAYDGRKEARASATRETGVIPADVLCLFSELVTSLGGDCADLCGTAGLDPRVLVQHGGLALAAAARALDVAQRQLDCPDFGMQLATRQRGARKDSLFELVMRNSPTVGDALRYCSRHCRPCSGTVAVSLQPSSDGRRAYLSFEILAVEEPGHQQLLELMMLRTWHVVSDMSGGRIALGEVWFAHQPIASPATYRDRLGCVVRFAQESSGFFIDAHDLAIGSVDPDPQIHALAAYFIENKLPEFELSISAQVRTWISRLLPTGQDCTRDEIALRLGLHRRTMQRRLQDEGTSFETIKDEVRREVALRLLGQTDVSLSRLAEMLGYAEVSALSRSFNRWFAASPRKLRRELTACAA